MVCRRDFNDWIWCAFIDCFLPRTSNKFKGRDLLIMLPIVLCKSLAYYTQIMLTQLPDIYSLIPMYCLQIYAFIGK